MHFRHFNPNKNTKWLTFFRWWYCHMCVVWCWKTEAEENTRTHNEIITEFRYQKQIERKIYISSDFQFAFNWFELIKLLLCILCHSLWSLLVLLLLFPLQNISVYLNEWSNENEIDINLNNCLLYCIWFITSNFELIIWLYIMSCHVLACKCLFSP